MSITNTNHLGLFREVTVVKLLRAQRGMWVLKLMVNHRFSGSKTLFFT
jgi:hypothetical protein